MKNDTESLKFAEKGDSGGVWGILLIAIVLSLFVAIAFSGGDPVYTPPTATIIAGAGRQQAARPTQGQETAVSVTVATLPVSTPRPAQASRPSGDATNAAVPTWTPQPTYTPYPTNTAVPTVAPTQTPLPTYTAAPSYTPLPTYTAVPTVAPTETQRPLMAIAPLHTPPAPSLNSGDRWLILGMALCAVLFVAVFGAVLMMTRPQRPLVVGVSSLPPAPQRQILPPPTMQPKRALAPVPPVPSTSATSANAPVAPVLPGQGGKMSLTVTPDQNEFNQAEVERLRALYWQLPEGERTQNNLIAVMWGRNERGEPKKGPGRNAVVQYVMRLCKEQERQTRIDEMTINSGGRTVPIADRIRNQPPQPGKRPFVAPIKKGVEG